MNSAYLFSYTVAGFPTPSFSLTSGALPDGLSLTSSGSISGAPDIGGTYSGVITASTLTVDGGLVAL